MAHEKFDDELKNRESKHFQTLESKVLNKVSFLQMERRIYGSSNINQKVLEIYNHIENTLSPPVILGNIAKVKKIKLLFIAFIHSTVSIMISDERSVHNERCASCAI